MRRTAGSILELHHPFWSVPPAETVGTVEYMTAAPALPPVHMRRNAFDPVPELGEIRDGRRGAGGDQRVRHAGLPGHPPRRRQGDAFRPRALRQLAPTGIRAAGRSRDARGGAGQRTRGQPVGARPTRTSAAAQNAHPGVHHPPDEAARTAHRRDRHRAPRRHGGRGRARRPGGVLRAAHPVAGDLRTAGRPVRRPRRLPEASFPPARPVCSRSPNGWRCSGRAASTCTRWWTGPAASPARTSSAC